MRIRAYERLLADHVSFPSIGLALEQGRTTAVAGASDCFACVAINLEHVIAIDYVSGDSVTLRPHRDVFYRRDRLHRRELTETVVFAYEHDRELPHSREIQRFVKSSFIGGAVAEETG